MSASPESLIQKTQNVALVLKCGGLWFVGGKFGITWKLMQGVVQPRATLRGKCHIKLNVAEKDLMQKQATELDDEQQDDNVGIEVQDSDDEDEQQDSTQAQDEEEEEEEEPVAPEPPKKKKVVRRKKTAAQEEN